MDYNPPASSVHGILQAQILECVAISYFRESSQPSNWTHVSCISCIAGRFFTTTPPGKLIYIILLPRGKGAGIFIHQLLSVFCWEMLPGFLCFQNSQPALWEDRMVSSCWINSQAEIQMLTSGGGAFALQGGGIRAPARWAVGHLCHLVNPQAEMTQQTPPGIKVLSDFKKMFNSANTRSLSLWS